MQIINHGGGCCGIRHIQGFGSIDYASMAEAFVKEFKDLMEPFTRPGCNLLVEAVLTDRQMVSGWAKVLKDFGFRHVSRFKNSNSHNYVNVLHFTRSKRNRVKMPFTY